MKQTMRLECTLSSRVGQRQAQFECDPADPQCEVFGAIGKGFLLSPVSLSQLQEQRE